MKVSVIVPTYKPKIYLWECLDSLCKQTFAKEEYEVILVLNGCKEPFDTNIQQYLAIHPEVCWNYIQTDKAGVSHARNLALNVAKGSYITFIDDDDFVSPLYLEELYKYSGADTMSLCYPFAFNDSNANFQLSYYITDEYNSHVKNEKIPSYKVRKYYSGPCMKCLSQTIIGNTRFDENFKVGEDSIFMLQISDKIKYCTFTSKQAIYYRRFRQESAVSLQKDLFAVTKNCVRMFGAFSRIYWQKPFTYNFRRYLYACLGVCHTILDSVMNHIR